MVYTDAGLMCGLQPSRAVQEISTILILNIST